MARCVSRVPHRSPEAVIDALSNLLHDKVACDLGCGDGDIMVFMSRYARRVVGIELPGGQMRRAALRGLDVVAGDMLVEDFPPADVYYVWISQHLNLFVVKKLLSDDSFHGIIVVAMGDRQTLDRQPEFKEFAHTFCESRLVPYNEGDGPRESGTFGLVTINADHARRLMAAKS